MNPFLKGVECAVLLALGVIAVTILIVANLDIFKPIDDYGNNNDTDSRVE